uniref:Endoplasmic reticulum-Golgi intermediate compartment protein n=1 Tax=Macaca nemestrina TaxID=9545 RepID=A0A2K6BWJ6_MACNE
MEPWAMRVNELYVDDPDKDSGGKIDVSLNISLPNLHCELVGLDIQDEMGRHEVGHIDNSMKIPLNNGAGCRFEGQFSINKVRKPCLSPFYLLPIPAVSLLPGNWLWRYALTRPDPNTAPGERGFNLDAGVQASCSFKPLMAGSGRSYFSPQ